MSKIVPLGVGHEYEKLLVTEADRETAHWIPHSPKAQQKLVVLSEFALRRLADAGESLQGFLRLRQRLLENRPQVAVELLIGNLGNGSALTSGSMPALPIAANAEC
jgi:hypothetical protein